MDKILNFKINRRTTYAVKQLTDGQGFVMNMTPAREDRKAREACNMMFGTTLVDNITASLHRSSLTYEALLSDFLDYDRQHVSKQEITEGSSGYIYRMVLQSVRDDLKIETTLPMMTFEQVRRRPDYPGPKSPGLPHKLNNYKTKSEVYDDPHRRRELEDIWRNVAFGRVQKLPDVCLFARAQIARTGKEKIRATWGYPFDVYMQEACFFYPIQDYIKEHKHNLPIAYGLEMAAGGMTALNSMLSRNPDSQYAMTDWSKFDKTIPVWLIRDAFSILSELVDFASYGSEYHNRRKWKKVVDYFCETPIRTCKGERFLVTGGVPSGSCFTNLIDTVINCIMTRYLMYQTTGSFPKDEIYLGDDGVVVHDAICLEDFASLALKYFGTVLNVSKSYVTTNITNVHFLGYFNLSGYPFKNQDFLIASFIYPEHRRSKLIDACAAALGQMYSGFDPGYAKRWCGIIRYLADCEINDPFSYNDISIHLRANGFRHKYLAHVGIDTDNLTIPDDNKYIVEVLPASCPRVTLKKRVYDYESLYARC